MKKLSLVMMALLFAGATFACDGDKGKKACCKKDAKKECCKKGEKKGCDKSEKKADEKKA